MASNKLASMLKEAYEKGRVQGVMEGTVLGHNLDVIAINHLWHKGETQIARLEEYVNELYREIVVVNDPDLTRHNIDKALKQIRGADFESGYVEPKKG